jgi:ribonuclease HI
MRCMVPCQKRMSCPSPMVAEALAARLAVCLCDEMGFTQVHFEGDSRSVVDAMNNQQWWRGQKPSGDGGRGPHIGSS